VSQRRRYPKKPKAFPGGRFHGSPKSLELNDRGATHEVRDMAKAPMSALTIRQPYAWLMVNGYKVIENRSWKPAAARIGQRFWVPASQRRADESELRRLPGGHAGPRHHAPSEVD
jgi:hypothetical protein